MFTITESWGQIGLWLQKHSPPTAAVLAPPADRAEIKAAEQKIGREFPEELVESLLCHNGLVNSQANVLPDGYPPLSVEWIVKIWEVNVRINADLSDDDDDDDDTEDEDDDGEWETDDDLGEDPWWDAEWVPFASMDSETQFIDGGMLEMHFHDSGVSSRHSRVSLQDYLHETAVALMTGGDVDGRYPYLDEDGELFWLTEKGAETWGQPLRRGPAGVD